MSKPAQPVLDASHPLSRGLVGYWPCGQTTSAAQDLVTGAIAPAVNGPLAFSSAARGGVANTFNGSNQAFAGASGQYNLRSWSVSAWLYSTTTGGGLQVAVAQADAGAANYQFWVGNSGAGFTVASSTYVSISTTPLTANTWHHVVAGVTFFDTSTNPTMYYYTDGVLTLSQVVGGSGNITSGLGSFAIGRLGAYTGGVFWPGNIENVRIYNRMLFPGEVQQLFAEPFAGIYEVSGNIGGIASVSANVNLTGVSGTAAAGTLSTNTAVSVSLSGVSATAAVGTLGHTISSSVTLTGAAATAGVGSLVPGVSYDVSLSGVSAAAAIGDLALGVTSTFDLVGVEATAGIGILPPTQVLVTVPLLTIMNDNPVPVEGDMVGDYIPMEEDMPSQIALETVLNTNPIPMTGTLSAVPIPAEGSVP